MRVMIVFVFTLVSVPAVAQEVVKIDGYLERIKAGEMEEVRDEVPALLDRYPDDPGVQYLEGVVTEDGADAVRIFQGIVENHPDSQWADDALFRVYQFYYAIGLYRTAGMKWDQLREQYPTSAYLSSGPQPADSEDEEGPPTSILSGEVAEKPAQADSVHDLPGGQFALQVGAYSSRENAEKQKLFFEDLGYPVEVINRVRDERSLFLVLVGNYLTYEEAKVKGAGIRRSYNIESFVVSR